MEKPRRAPNLAELGGAGVRFIYAGYWVWANRRRDRSLGNAWAWRVLTRSDEAVGETRSPVSNVTTNRLGKASGEDCRLSRSCWNQGKVIEYTEKIRVIGYLTLCLEGAKFIFAYELRAFRLSK